MSGQMRKKWAKAAVCAVALSAPLAVSGCASQAGTNSATGTTGTTGAQAGPASSASTAATPGVTPTTPSVTTGTASPAPASSPATPAAPATSAPSTAPVALNGTGGSGLVVADGSSKVLMNGKTVDFGTEVHDPAFTPDGKKVAFIDGDGNLTTANSDGTGKVLIAENTTGARWSHPTWQVTPTNQYYAARDNIFFASTAGGGTLWGVTATGHGKPQRLSLGHGAGRSVTELPQEGNVWPSDSGKFGTAVYEHDNGSSSDVYIRDDYLRQQGGLEIENAAQPSFALVGGSATTSGSREVAFVRTVNGHRHIFLSGDILSPTGGQPAAPKDLTPNATTDCSAPALSPNGKTVAYSTSAGVFTVSVTGSTPKQVTDVPGFPSFRTVF